MKRYLLLAVLTILALATVANLYLTFRLMVIVSVHDNALAEVVEFLNIQIQQNIHSERAL